MKNLILALLVLFTPAAAFANSEKIFCRNSDGSIQFTRDTLVWKTTDRTTLISELESYQTTDGNNLDPRPGDVLEFKSSYEGQPSVMVTVTKSGARKEVVAKEDKCGVGFVTSKFELRAEVTVADLKQKERFSCLHYLSYHGHNCR